MTGRVCRCPNCVERLIGLAEKVDDTYLAARDAMSAPEHIRLTFDAFHRDALREFHLFMDAGHAPAIESAEVMEVAPVLTLNRIGGGR